MQSEEEQTAARAIEQAARKAPEAKRARHKNTRRRGACGAAKIEEAKRKDGRRRQESEPPRFKKQVGNH